MKTVLTARTIGCVPRRGYRAWQFALCLVRGGATYLFGGVKCLCCGRSTYALPLCASCSRALFAFTPLYADAASADDTSSLLHTSVAPVASGGSSSLRHRVDAVSAAVGIVLPSPARCRVCGKVLLSEIEYCMRCRTQPVLRHTDGVFPLHGYQLWRKMLLHAWKSEGQRALSPFFAAMVYRALVGLYRQCGMEIPVVPVPPRPGKIRREGWDQIAELCTHLRHGYGVTLRALLRRISCTQQKRLRRTERLAYASASYALSRRGRRLLRRGAPRAVVLVDDVLTTGATLESCAQVLKMAGVTRVYAITLFAVE